MKNLTMALIAMAALTSVGCNTTGGGDAPGSAAASAKGSAAAASGSAAPAAGAGCPAGFAAGPGNAFCIKVPAAVKPGDPYDKDSKSKRIDYSDGAGNGLTVVVTKFEEEGDWEYELKSLTDQAKKKEYKDVKVEDLSDGKYFSWVESDGQWVTALHRKGKEMKYVFCRLNGKPADPALVDACKTLSPL